MYTPGLIGFASKMAIAIPVDPGLMGAIWGGKLVSRFCQKRLRRFSAGTTFTKEESVGKPGS
jgi:hypothetical protein